LVHFTGDPGSEFGGHVVSAEREPITEVFGRVPSGVQGRASG